MGDERRPRRRDAARAMARIHRVRRDGVRFYRTTSGSGAAQLLCGPRASANRRAQRQAAPDRALPGLRSQRRRPPLARRRARAVLARARATARRRPASVDRARGPGRDAGVRHASPRTPCRIRTARGDAGAPGNRPRRSCGPALLMASSPRSISIAAGQGFWGDWLEAPYRQVTGGSIDYLMMDYLAEVTMSILQKQRSRDPNMGYARDFVGAVESVLPAVADRGVRVIANAGGVNPPACAAAIRDLAR